MREKLMPLKRLLFFSFLFPPPPRPRDNDNEQTMVNDSTPVQGSLMHVQDFL